MPVTTVAQRADTTSELDDPARIRMYGSRAVTIVDPDARADLFGTLLTTCTHCHAALRDR